MLTPLLILAFGTFIQSSSYVPLRKIRGWSWETYWLLQGMFAWILLPLAGALLAIRSVPGLVALYASHPLESLACMGFGFLWGVGSLTFGLAVRYLGISLGQTVAIGLCSAFGSVLGPILSGQCERLTPPVLAGVTLMLAGVVVVMLAALRKSRLMSPEQKVAAVPDFNLKKGVAVVILSGLMSAFFNVGLDFGRGIIPEGVRPEFSSLPIILPVTCGGFVLNLFYCLYLGRRNGSMQEFRDKSAWNRNLGFCAMTGAFWYSQFFALSIVRGMMAEHPVFVTFSWCILMTLNILFTNFWGLVLREWRGTGRRTSALLICGLCLLILSIFLPFI